MRRGTDRVSQTLWFMPPAGSINRLREEDDNLASGPMDYDPFYLYCLSVLDPTRREYLMSSSRFY